MISLGMFLLCFLLRLFIWVLFSCETFILSLFLYFFLLNYILSLKSISWSSILCLITFILIFFLIALLSLFLLFFCHLNDIWKVLSVHYLHSFEIILVQPSFIEAEYLSKSVINLRLFEPFKCYSKMLEDLVHIFLSTHSLRDSISVCQWYLNLALILGRRLLAKARIYKILLVFHLLQCFCTNLLHKNLSLCSDFIFFIGFKLINFRGICNIGLFLLLF